MQQARRLGTLLVLAALGGCDTSTGIDLNTVVGFGFGDGAQGWTAHFADYPVGEESFYELESGVRRLPAPLDTTRRAFFLSGNNHSDDLFMFAKRPLPGLQPNTAYRVHWEVELASNQPSGCVGVGGAPGESVYLKAGATIEEPTLEQEDGYYRVSIDKGNQAAGGADAVVLGDLANGDRDCLNPSYRLKRLRSPAPGQRLRTDATGTAWLLVGIDSGFEATASVYLTGIRVRFAME